MSKFKLLVILLVIFICTGCGTSISDSLDEGVKKCSRTGTIDGAKSYMNYEIHYKGQYITVLHSTEKVLTSDQAILDVYEEAYENIFKAYEGLKYYDAKVKRDENSVTSDITINYEKIDIDALLKIEGAEDNVVDEDGKVKLSTWLDFAEPFGVKCD